MGVVYCYARGSTSKQELTTKAQEEQLQRYVAYRFCRNVLKEGEEKPEFGGVYVDLAVTSKIPLHDRPAGKRLVERMAPGDHFVVCKMDRAFRNCREAYHWIDSWRIKGITIHVLNMGCDTGSLTGTLLMQVMAAFAEFERCQISERTREAMRYRRAHGLSVGGRPKPW